MQKANPVIWCIHPNALLPLNPKLTLNQCHEINIPDLPLKDIASEGIMSLTRAGTNLVYGRGVPENTIFRAKLNNTGSPYLDNLELVVSKDDFPHTHDAKKVIGYEDPTFIGKEINPFFQGENGILCSQTYKLKEKKLGVNLVYIGLSKNGKATHIYTILTPQDIVKANVALEADMVKEGELFIQKDGRKYLFFEFGGSDNGKDFTSNIGLAEIKDGKTTSISKFYTAEVDNSEHISTDSNPLPLTDDLNLLFFNRRRNNEWGITYMIFNNNFNIQFVYPDFLIRAPKNIGFGPHNQLIAFVSHLLFVGDKEYEVFYHVNDKRPYYALINIETNKALCS